MDDKDVYKEWAEKSGEFWKDRCRKFLGEEYENLLRVARAADYVVSHVKHKAMCPGIDRLRKALKEVKDIL